MIKITWKRAPVVIPKADKIPAFFPWDILLLKIYMVSVPGVIFKIIQAIKLKKLQN